MESDEQLTAKPRKSSLGSSTSGTETLQNIFVEMMNGWRIEHQVSLRSPCETIGAALGAARVPSFYVLTIAMIVIMLTVRTLLLGLVAWLDTLAWLLILVVLLRLIFQYEWALQRRMSSMRSDTTQEMKQVHGLTECADEEEEEMQAAD